MTRDAWLAVAQRVLAGETSGLRCPVCDHAALKIEWLPTGDGTGGEYHLRCDNCGAENFVLKRE
jgi:hypothetical protein